MKSFILDKNSPLELISQMGGKAKNLYLMETQKINIPSWFSLSTEIYDKYFQQYEERISLLLSASDLKDLDSLNSLSLKINDLFKTIKLDDHEKKLILDRIDEKKFYAVRSSALGEDGTASSYAGQLSSFLYIQKNDIINSIIDCWSSAFTARIIQYNSINNIDYFALKVGVIIQEMVDSKKSGVMFTVNPMLSDDFTDEAVITAGYGVGEGIVADLVETDTYTYNRIKKSITKKEFSTKTKMIVMGKKGGTVEKTVPSSLQKRSVLNNNEISKLVGFGTILYRFYGHEVDIEWAIDDKGELFFTQARPITTLGSSFGKPIFFLDNSNVVESFPGVNTPWTLSIIRDVYTEVFTNAVKRLGISSSKINHNKIALNHLIGSYKGRVFYNLTHWYTMMRLVPYTERYIKVWEEMLGVESSELSISKTSKLKAVLINPIEFSWVCLKFSYTFVTLDYSLGRLDKKLRKNFKTFWKEESTGAFYKYEPHQYIQHIEKFKLEIFQNWDLTLVNDIYAFVFTSFSKWLLKGCKIENIDNFFNDLMFGVSGMDSVAPVKSMARMSDLIRNDELLKKKLEALVLTNTPYIKSLTDGENELSFRKLFNHHIDEFGDRGVEELKLETKTYREDPIELMKMVLEYSKSNIQGLSGNTESTRREAAESILKKELLKHPVKKVLFPFILKMAKRSINYRENFRLHRSRAYGIVRRLTNLLGDSLVKRDLINSRDDIYLLDYYSLFHTTHAISYDQSLKEQVERNRELKSEYLKLSTSEKYTYSGKQFQKVESDSFLTSESLSGSACSSGKVRGRALVVENIDTFNKESTIEGDCILVAPMTDPGWVFLMTISKGLVVEKGSILSHTAIIGRELGIPTIVGVKNATKRIKTGDFIEIDGDSGKINILGESNE